MYQGQKYGNISRYITQYNYPYYINNCTELQRKYNGVFDEHHRAQILQFIVYTLKFETPGGLLQYVSQSKNVVIVSKFFEFIDLSIT